MGVSVVAGFLQEPINHTWVDVPDFQIESLPDLTTFIYMFEIDENMENEKEVFITQWDYFIK